MKNERWWAVTFATPEFEAVALRWKQMVMDLGGSPVIVRRESAGNWEDNTGLKPAAIMDAMGVASEAPWVLFTDADAEILSVPAVPDLKWDIGLVDNPNPHHKNRVTAAAMFVRNTQAAQKFLWAWAQRCAAQGGIDHPKLTRTIEKVPEGVGLRRTERWVRWVANGLSEVKPGWEDGKEKRRREGTERDLGDGKD